MLTQALILVVSTATLAVGAELTLSSSEKIGRRLGLSPFAIGLLLIGFGTSLPELIVSHMAVWKNTPQIALGNIVGSNTANLFLILGIAGLITPLPLSSEGTKTQLLLHIFITILLTLTLLYLGIGIPSLLISAVFFGIYLKLTLRHKSSAPNTSAPIRIPTILYLVLGILLLYFSGDFLVSSGTALAESLGISPYVVSAVFVAFGTSFPELVTAIMTCLKKRDTALITGNIIGSNIFNVAFVLGGLGVYTIPIENKFKVELAALMAASLLLLALYLLKKKINQVIGGIFLITYTAIVFYWMGQ